jgi:hypothetical protein
MSGVLTVTGQPTITAKVSVSERLAAFKDSVSSKLANLTAIPVAIRA